MMRDKAKVLLTLFIALIGLSGCATTKAPSQEALRLTEPLVVASVFALSEEVPQEAKVQEEPRIKIVSGDGMPLSAKRLSKELTDRGYKIDRVDVAPFAFKKPTVFYAPGFDVYARDIAEKIDAKGGVKPLSWKSVYDIIIVSVNN